MEARIVMCCGGSFMNECVMDSKTKIWDTKQLYEAVLGIKISSSSVLKESAEIFNYKQSSFVKLNSSEYIWNAC